MSPRPARPTAWARRVAAVAVAALVAVVVGAALPAFAGYAEIDGDGSTWSQVILNQWISDVTASGIKVVYNGNGSSQGRTNFAGSMDDFAISEIPYQGTDELEAVDSSTRPYAYLPIVAGGTAFTYHLEVGGQLVRGIRLSGETIAKIFTNQITNWSDPAITADNNGRVLPDLAIVPVVRSDGSGTTAQLTTWFEKQYPSIWQPYFGRSGTTSYYPTKSGSAMLSAPGSDDVMNTISAGAGNGTIGYVEYSYALNKDYPVVKVLNAAGYYVEPTAFNVAVALTTAQINQDPTSNLYLTPILDGVYTNPDPRAYPLSSYSSMIIPTSANDTRMTTDRRQSLVDLAAHALCTGQSEAATYGYSPLPLNLVQAGFDQLAKLKTADPGVDIQKLDLTACANPTFDRTDLTRNVLGEIASQPAACDKTGAGPCTGSPDGIAVTLGVPRDPNAPGSLTLVVPAGANVALSGSRDSGNTRVTATADLPAITVDDTRRDDLVTAWQVNVQASDFSGPAGSLSAKYLGWSPAAPSVTPELGSALGAQAGPAVSSALDAASSTGLGTSRLLGGSIASGRGGTSLGATLGLAVQSSTPEGSYSCVLTVTLVAS